MECIDSLVFVRRHSLGASQSFRAHGGSDGVSSSYKQGYTRGLAEYILIEGRTSKKGKRIRCSARSSTKIEFLNLPLSIVSSGFQDDDVYSISTTSDSRAAEVSLAARFMFLK